MDESDDIMKVKPPADRLAGAAERFRAEISHGDATLSPGSPDSRLLLESIFSSISDGVAVVDRQGKFLLFNDAAQRILGRGVADVPLDHWHLAFGCFLPDKVTPYPPGDLPLARALRGEHVNESEIFIRHDGKPAGAWISVNSSPLLDGDRGVYGGVVVFRDITRRRRATEFVRQMTKAVERTADAVFITDLGGVIDYVNPAFEKTTGFARNEAVGKTPRILRSGEHAPEYYQGLWETILAGKVHTGTVINRAKDGRIYHAEQTITPIKDTAGNLSHFVSVVRDITALKKAEERDVEMRLARAVQQRLYPSSPPQIAGYDLAGAVFPTDETCGDYFDFITMWGNSTGIAVGDVSGHGFSSALLMAETRAYLRSLVRTTPDLCSTLEQLNAFLCADTDDGRFVTLMLVRIDPQRDGMTYASAGHSRGYVIDRGGTTRHVLGATGRPLGLFPDYRSTDGQILLNPGDVMLLMTDGVTEVADDSGEFFGDERAIEVVAACRDLPAERIVERLYEAAMAFSPAGSQADDITIVVCKRID